MKRTNMMNLVFVLRLYMKHLSFSTPWIWFVQMILNKLFSIYFMLLMCWACFCLHSCFPTPHSTKVQTRNIVNGCIKFPYTNFFMWKHFSRQIINLLEHLPLYWFLKITFWRWRMCGKEFVSFEVLKLEIKTFMCKDEK